MMTCINRNSANKFTPLFFGGTEGAQSAEEYLKSAGYDLDKMPELVWPDGAVKAYQDDCYAPWQFVYKSDILREKKEQMEKNLWWKREYGVEHRQALYVWVFWCPGFFGFAFRGWWTYLTGRGISYGKFLKSDKETVRRIMELFPPPKTLFGSMSFDDWMQWFVKHYQRGEWCGKPQGKSPVWALVGGGSVREILGRAEWPEMNHEESEKRKDN